MSLKHLDILRNQLPEIFQDRDVISDWQDNWIFVPIDDPECVFSESDNIADPNTYEECLNWQNLENYGANFVEPGSPAPELSHLIIDILGGAHSGSPIATVGSNSVPPPDCLAFYLPFHYYHPTYWGVYLLFEGVVWLAGEIVKRSNGSVNRRQAIQAARLFLYHHEAFHHKTECFSTRLELSHRKPLYKTGFERLYQRTFGTNDCLEEGLANASALADTERKMRDPSINKSLESYVLSCPPGYNQGVQIRDEFQSTRCVFAEKNQNVCLPHLPTKDPDIWRSAPHMFNGIANIKSHVNYLIPRNSPLVNRLPLRPLLPASKLIKKLKDKAGLEFVRNGSNHDVYRASNGKKITIPRHPGDLGRGLIRKILSEAGLDIGLEEFMQQ